MEEVVEVVVELKEVEEEVEEVEVKDVEDKEVSFVWFCFLISLIHRKNLSISSMLHASNLPNKRRHAFASLIDVTSQAAVVKAKRIRIPT